MDDVIEVGATYLGRNCWIGWFTINDGQERLNADTSRTREYAEHLARLDARKGS